MATQDKHPEYESDQRGYFDEQIVEDWDSYSSPEWDAVRRFEVARLLARVQPATILDVGCGCGFHDLEMARRPFIERIDAIDYSEESIRKAEKHYGHPKVRRQAADLAEYAPPESCDLVVSFQVIEHVEDAAGFLKRCAALARRGGTVAAFTVNRVRPYNRKRMQYGKEPELEDPMHRCEFTMDELRGLGEVCGLETQSVFGYMADWPRMPHRLALWGGYLLPRDATRLGALYRVR